MRRFLLVAALISSAPVLAAEAITYVYDGQGRLMQVVRAGSVNNGVTVYALDKVSNRTNKTMSGSPYPPPP